MAKKIIYLDNASTTPQDRAVLAKMKPYLTSQYGNPSNLYSLGQKAKQAVDQARQVIAQFLGCLAEEIIFTASATESNNLAILGLVKKFREQNPNIKPHLITSTIEHPSVLKVCQALKKDGLAEVTFLKVSKEGLIDPKAVKNHLKDNTVLVSIMYANNEIGSVQPIKEIGKIIQAAKKSSGYPFFHTDAVQAINYLDCQVKKLQADLLTFNGHKIFGPKGIGVLYIKKQTPVSPLIYGGQQEGGMRSGTENVAGIVGLAEAVKKAKNQKSKIKNIERLKNKLAEKLLKNIPETAINGSLKNSLPNIINFSFKRAEGESLVFELGQKNIFVSTGSACASSSLKPSYVLTAIGLTPIAAHCSIRFSLGKYTKTKDIDYVVKVLAEKIKRLRGIAGK